MTFKKIERSRYNDNEETVIKRYAQHYEPYMMDLNDVRAVNAIRKNISSAVVSDITFDEEELAWIYGFAFSGCSHVRHNDNGTVFISGNLRGVFEKFQDKITSILPGSENSPFITGNYFITPDQYGLHNDSTRQRDWLDSVSKVNLDDPERKYVPWKNIIIPLWTCPHNVESHAVFFKQRHIDFAHVYNHGKPKDQPVATTYPVIDNYGDIQFHDEAGNLIPNESNLIPYDKEHYDRYLYYTPYRRLTGLIPELTCIWTPGHPIVFDAMQLHATNKGLKDNQWTVKMGLLLSFFKEVEEN